MSQTTNQTNPKDVLLIALGSAGDVHPFVGVGAELRRRGHDVTVMANPKFKGLIDGMGLGFHPAGTEEDYDRTIQNPDLWHPMKGFKLVMQFGFIQPMRPVYEFIRERYRAGRTVVAAHGLALGARVAQEKLGVPTATVQLAPAVFRSVHKTPYLHPLKMGDGWPKWLKRSLFWVVDRVAVDPVLVAPLHRFRREMGLTGKVRRVMKGWWESPERLIGMFPEFFGPVQPDWPVQTRLTGFPLYDGRGVDAVPEELEAFLAAGDRPVFFTPGSANTHARAFFEAAVGALSALGKRGVLLTRYRENVPAELPAGVKWFPYAPLSKVLSRGAALVCHGGIGTVAQGFAAGVPQVVMALAHDQFDNGERVQRLGAGRYIISKKFTAKWLTGALGGLLGNADVARTCAGYRDVIAGQNGVAAAADAIEELG